MKPVIEMKEAKAWHCGQAVRLMRDAHQLGLQELGIDAHRELSLMFGQSLIRQTCFVNGKLAALWGVSGTLASNVGFVWMVLTHEALALPKEIIRQTRKHLDQLMERYAELATTVLASDEAALRFALFLGFHTRDDEPEKDRKRLSAKIMAEGPKILIGDTFVIPLGYHLPEGG